MAPENFIGLETPPAVSRIDLTKPRRAAITIIPQAASNQRILGPSEKRRALWIVPSVNGPAFGVNNRPLANIDDGFNDNYALSFIPMRYEDFGDILCGPWYVFCAGAVGNVVAIESLEI